MGTIALEVSSYNNNPKSAADYLTRGIIRGQKGYLESAIADYDQTIQLNPNDTLAYK